MKILHTADWHVGKRLGRLDRTAETEAVLDEIVAVAADREVDLVVVAGDLFDRGIPPFASLRSVLGTLVRLAATGAQVVAIPGNHDSPELFEVLAPHLVHSGVTLVHKPLPADAGGVVTIPSRDGRESARVACFPFLHQAHVVDFMGEHEDRHKGYSQRVRDICRHYASWLEDRPEKNAIDVLVGHFMIHNAVPSGSERPLHVGEAYMASEDAVPPGFHYVALGHIHRAQPAPGSEDHARYCGSVIQLDFGEAEQGKGVVLVDVDAQGRRHIETIPLTAGRRLVKIKGTLDELKERAAELGDAVLSVEVVTDRASVNLADEVQAFLPGALFVRVDNPRAEPYEPRREGMSLAALYAEYHEQRFGNPPSPELASAFDELADELGVAL